MLIVTLIVIWLVCSLGTGIYVTFQAEKRGVELSPRYALIFGSRVLDKHKKMLTPQERTILTIGNLWIPLFLFLVFLVARMSS